MLEIKMNKEIENYTESIFFGLSLRQFIFSFLACGVAVGTYFLLRGILGMEMTSWVCIVAAFPFAALGFVKYNGMTAEQLAKAIIKSEFITPKKLVMGNGCYLYEEFEEELKQKRRAVPNRKFIIGISKDKYLQNPKGRRRRGKAAGIEASNLMTSETLGGASSLMMAELRTAELRAGKMNYVTESIPGVRNERRGRSRERQDYRC